LTYLLQSPREAAFETILQSRSKIKNENDGLSYAKKLQAADAITASSCHAAFCRFGNAHPKKNEVTNI